MGVEGLPAPPELLRMLSYTPIACSSGKECECECECECEIVSV